MQPSFPDGTRVTLSHTYGTLPPGSAGTVQKTVFIGLAEYCDVDFDDIPGTSTVLVLAAWLQ